MFRRPDDSQSFLEQHPELVCEETANHLVIWCVDLVIEEVSYASFNTHWESYYYDHPKACGGFLQIYTSFIFNRSTD